MYKILGGDGKEYGPITAETLTQWIAEGRANAETQVQVEGATGWVPLGSLPEFATAAAAAQPAPGSFAATAAEAVGGREAALRLAVPAGWALTVIGILGVLMCIGTLAFITISGIENYAGGMLGKPPASEAERMGRAVGVCVSLVIGIGSAAFIAFAGGRLRQLRSWGLVLTAGIFCLLPCCGNPFPLCLLSAPIGIWVIVVICLNKVKPAFT